MFVTSPTDAPPASPKGAKVHAGIGSTYTPCVQSDTPHVPRLGLVIPTLFHSHSFNMLVPLVLLAALAGSAAAGGPVTISLASDRSTMEMGMAKPNPDSSSNTNSLYYYVPWEIG